jgi:hypothetical protein
MDAATRFVVGRLSFAVVRPRTGYRIDMGFAERFAYRLYVILFTKKATIPNRLLQGAGLRLRNVPFFNVCFGDH